MTQNASPSAARLARLRAQAANQDRGAYFARDTSDIAWLTAFDGVFDEEQAHALFVDAANAVLHTDSRYSHACRMAAEANGNVVSVDDGRTTHAAFAAERWHAAQSAGSFAFDDGITLANYRALEKAFAEGDAQGPAFAETHDVVRRLRAVKDAHELERMRYAQSITDAAFAHIVTFIRPGRTEREVQRELDDYMLSHGAAALAFPSIVAAGANGASPHAQVTDAPLQAGTCIVMDFGAKARGYCSDMTRTVFLGEPDARMRSAYDTIRRANEEVEALLAPGVMGAQAQELAERILDEGGFGGAMGHGLGHGVGLDIHELPVLNSRNGEALVPGNVVTVEPGIYLPGEFGMRLEDCGVVTEDGFEVFTAASHSPVIL